MINRLLIDADIGAAWMTLCLCRLVIRITERHNSLLLPME